MDGHKSITTYKIDVSHDYKLHVEESGNPDGIPILFLHGGPGAGIGQNYQWPFASGNFRVIAFDQRGCGKSQPFGSLENNTTDLLIQDIELLRAFFSIDSWAVFGGSWGSALALAYSIKHPQKVIGLVLRGVFLARAQDIEWFLSSSKGASQVFPTEYKDFTGEFSDDNTSYDILCKRYLEQLTHDDEKVRHAAAVRWFNWEGNISKLKKHKQNSSDFASIQQIYSLALYECFYIVNECFMPEDYLLNHCHKIGNTPVYIVQGRYDMVCKCEAAISLHRSLANSTINIIEDAGHSMTENGISKGLVHALNKLEQDLQNTPSP